ncbi:hypothetical protein EXIGLDRAFT_837495 [Exidia glandulosa HHB12029]|uniref:PLC-like phosphodiesterase n=1 Tax=Exidia glandulosa HHB12029 TaxID=1314781 RepID=A0A165GS56_EXIGL|nr:hypothetical protein EXIGLDRAFT_837495 [Exidia glandulosa HHB12029]
MLSSPLFLVALSLSLRGALADQTFASSVFRATHNSYSGNVDGAKDTINTQLDRGVRFIEFDFHDNGYATNADYGVGHTEPGNAVEHTSPNPAGNLLRDWLKVVNAWSAAHPTHAPIVLMLDVKDDLTDNPTYAAGNPAALNQELKDVFGSRLLWAQDAPAGLPSIDALRGRVLPVMSGDATTRSSYKSDSGSNPSIARNSRGMVVEVHDDGGSNLWYWSGKIASDGTVTWLRHGKYDSGKNPAVALNDDGWLVEVHQSSTLSKLWSHTGRVDANTGEITWSSGLNYDDGVNPTVQFTSPTATTVREIHKSQSNSQNWNWSGALNTGTAAGSLAWSGNAKTSDAIFDKAQSTGIAVLKDAGGKIAYSAGQIVGKRIAYEQVFFVESQSGDGADLKDGAIFFAAASSDKSFLTSARNAGKVTRGWDFDSASDATTPIQNYPATNHPYDSWYDQLLTANKAIQ